MSMYRKTEFLAALRKRGLDESAIQTHLQAIAGLDSSLAARGLSLERPELAAVEAWLSERLREGESIYDFLIPAARYFTAARQETVAIRLMAYLLPIGVLPAMADRLTTLEGEAVRSHVMSGVAIPAEGSPPEAYPDATARFVEALEAEIGPEKARRVLAWNVHEIPTAAFALDRERFLDLGSIDAWLLDHHRRQVEILRRHAKDGTLWFEQRITRAVVDFVEARPEILGGVREGDIIYTTKIPYDPDGYLQATDGLERRRLACHCPLALASITERDAGVPPLWCACSAGYTKFMFDVVFGEETEAVVLESVLSGSERCRFAIKIPPSVCLGA